MVKLFAGLSGLLPARYVLGVMGCIGVTLALMLRSCLAIAITEMVQNTKPSENNEVSAESCVATNIVPGNNTFVGKTFTTLDAKFDWDERTQGVILSSFYYGYVLTHIPGGILSQKFGGKHTLGLGFLCTALLTLLTPIMAHYGSLAMIVLRFLEGVGEGTTFPALCTLLAQWSPPNERSFMTAMVFAGVQLGSVLATFCSGLIMSLTASWAQVFYIFGGLGVVWFVFWCALCYNDPKSHPFISEKERKYLLDSIGAAERRKDLETPWSAILCSLPVWALIIAEVGHDYGLYLISNDLPKYMSEVIGLTVSQNGILSALPFLIMWIVSMSSSALADYFITRGILSRTTTRKLFGTLGAVLPGVGALAASYVGCLTTLVAIFFTIGMAFMGFCYASIRVNPIDLSPNFSGTIMALSNGLGCLSGMVAPLSVGFLTENKTLSEWRVVFWIMFAALFISNIFFVMFGSGEVQDWNESTSSQHRNLDIEINDKETTPSPADRTKSVS
uniref:Sialin n=1 Tax=Cacopsylla melanoneura TaxID=428564 RepID=A0A8D8LG62_9HEMI